MTFRTTTAFSALLAAALGTAPAFAQEVVPLEDWDYDALADGWFAEELLGTAVQGPGGEDYGEIENIIVDAEGMAESIIVEAGGFLDMGDTHFSVPWDEAEFADDLETVTVPVTEENVDGFTLFETRGPIEGPADAPREWRAAELIGDYVHFEDGAGYGIVEDLVFAPSGELTAVIVEPDLAYGDVGPFAFPFYGYDFGFDPGFGYHELPYGEAEIEVLEPFDYDMALD